MRQDAQEIKRWAEGVGQGWLPVLVVLMVGVASFGMGRLSALESAQEPVRIIQAATFLPEPQGIHPGGLVVASRSGDKYHFPWCPGAETIKAANRIWFNSEEAARKAGYTPAGNCKGLK